MNFLVSCELIQVILDLIQYHHCYSDHPLHPLVPYSRSNRSPSTTTKTDYIDLFLIHGPLMGPEKRVDTWRNLVDFMHQSEGKIRAVGVSNFGIAHLEALKEAGLKVPSINQIEVSTAESDSRFMTSIKADSDRIPSPFCLTTRSLLHAAPPAPPSNSHRRLLQSQRYRNPGLLSLDERRKESSFPRRRSGMGGEGWVWVGS